ncbi:MAG: hypothetical protein EOP85_13500 [Verrucomicrobiaceae bacterium]|nr:MAG: hypothetical protein EOP85_13500 [Verrucomicrobiaceae bacterium]
MADPPRRSASSPEVGETHDEIPRSRRHADGAIEKHQAGMLRLMELENAVKEQETELEKKRKVVEAIVWTKGAMFMKNHPGYVPLSEIPKRTGSHDVEAGHPQDTMNAEDIRERSQSATGYADAKRDFETDLEQLKQLQLERDREKGRLKKQVR